MIKPDHWIVRMAREKGLIEPFEPRQVKVLDAPAGPRPVISYGVSSYGYDIRVDNSFRIMDPAQHGQTIIDPKNFDTSAFNVVSGPEILIPAHGLAIAQSFEYFRIPRDILVICQGKSTYSRCGVIVSISPLEPEWEGKLTFAIANTNSSPARVYSREGIAQILFLEAAEVCEVSYADKQGKYQRQTAFTPPKV